MDNRVIDEAAIRAYLLGRLSAEDELPAQFDERMLADPEFSLLMDVVEDEILEDYVDGLLTPAEVAAMEGHFLLPPERQLKLQRTRLISQHLSAVAAKKAPQSIAADRGVPERRRFVHIAGVRTWSEIAAGLVLAACTFYLWNQQRELRLAVQQSRHELAQLKQAQGYGPAGAKQTASVTLSLFVPGLSRGDPTLPEVRLTPGVETLHVSVALKTWAAGQLAVRLRQGTVAIWSSDGQARPVTGGAILAVDLPGAVVPAGTNELIVSLPGKGVVVYWFRVIKDQ